MDSYVLRERRCRLLIGVTDEHLTALLRCLTRLRQYSLHFTDATHKLNWLWRKRRFTTAITGQQRSRLPQAHALAYISRHAGLWAASPPSLRVTTGFMRRICSSALDLTAVKNRRGVERGAMSAYSRRRAKSRTHRNATPVPCLSVCVHTSQSPGSNDHEIAIWGGLGILQPAARFDLGAIVNMRGSHRSRARTRAVFDHSSPDPGIMSETITSKCTREDSDQQNALLPESPIGTQQSAPFPHLFRRFVSSQGYPHSRSINDDRGLDGFPDAVVGSH